MSAKTIWSCNNMYDKKDNPRGEIHSEHGALKGHSQDPDSDGWFVGGFLIQGIEILRSTKENRATARADLCSLDCAIGWAKAQLEKQKEAANVVSASAN